MKHINKYIFEKLKISKGPKYTLFPKTKEDLIDMIHNEIDKNGNECSLNHIDISKIEKLDDLFSPLYKLSDFNGDISNWDVSNVKSIRGMFEKSKFNGDLSKWDVSNVENMSWLFANSKFNNDSIWDWDVANVNNMTYMFYKSKFNYDISTWDVSKVTNMYYMFNNNQSFTQDISNWKINPDCDTAFMFYNSCIKQNNRPLKNNEEII